MLALHATMRSMVAPKDALVAQMRRGSLQYCVLALLARRELYAFELIQELAKADSLVTAEGTIYPLLSRLRREGAVETTWRESDQGPPRRYYRLSASGKTALTVFKNEWRQFRTAVDVVLEGKEHGCL